MKHRNHFSVWGAYVQFSSKANPRLRMLVYSLCFSLALLLLDGFRALFSYPGNHETLLSRLGLAFVAPLQSLMHTHYPALGNTFTFVLWALVGAAVYALGWLLHRLLNNLAKRKAKARRHLAYVFIALLGYGLWLGFLVYVLLAVILPIASEALAHPYHRRINYPLAIGGIAALTLTVYEVLASAKSFWLTVRFVNAATNAQRRTARKKR